MEEDEEEESSIANEDVDEATVVVVQELNTTSMIETPSANITTSSASRKRNDSFSVPMQRIGSKRKQPTNEDNTMDQFFKYLMMQRKLDHEENEKINVYNVRRKD